MTMMLILLIAIPSAFILALWLMGARQPVYAISAGEPAWFIALRPKGDAEPKLAAGVTPRWSSRADFALIGADDAYWRRFLIATGGDAGQSPVLIDDEIEDAYVARVRLRRPPRLALGLVRLLVSVGLLDKPRGEIIRDTAHTGFRPDAMPNATAIAQLLSMPSAYAPAMVNFLSYLPTATYPDGTPPSPGRAAYQRYGMVAMRTVYRTGGRLLFYGSVERVVREAHAGPTVGPWDDVAAMQYPAPHSILSMEHVPEYRAALIHRDAGLARTVVIATTPRK